MRRRRWTVDKELLLSPDRDQAFRTRFGVGGLLNERLIRAWPNGRASGPYMTIASKRTSTAEEAK
jgi:hypothetical protein